MLLPRVLFVTMIMCYQGNVSPVLPNLGYGSVNLDDSYSNGHLALSTSTPALPDRPDQPECRYFMNNGTCKYGSDCKFHHPKQRIAQSATNALGLPSRPVSFYILTHTKTMQLHLLICSHYSVN